MNLILHINLSYSIAIYYEVKEKRERLEYIQILWFTDNNSFIQGYIRGSQNKYLIILCTSVNNCVNNSINNLGTTHSWSKIFYYSDLNIILLLCDYYFLQLR